MVQNRYKHIGNCSTEFTTAHATSTASMAWRRWSLVRRLRKLGFGDSWTSSVARESHPSIDVSGREVREIQTKIIIFSLCTYFLSYGPFSALENIFTHTSTDVWRAMWLVEIWPRRNETLEVLMMLTCCFEEYVVGSGYIHWPSSEVLE